MEKAFHAIDALERELHWYSTWCKHHVFFFGGGDMYMKDVGVSAMFHDGICLNAVPSIRRFLLLFGGCSSRCRYFHVVNIQGRAPENKKETRGETTRAPRNRII